MPPPTNIMDAKVRSFNNLPKPEKLPGGEFANHWVIGICHVDVRPTYDLVIALSQHNPSTKQVRAEVLSLPTTQERAEATIPYLMDVFADSSSNLDRSVQLFAPWTWSTLDPDMAHALEDAIRKHGVKPELCKVGVCSAEERAHLEAIRDLCITQYAEWKGRKPNPVAWGDST